MKKFIYILPLISIIFIFTTSAVLAVDFQPQISIGKFLAGGKTTITGSTIGEYILEIYKYLIGAAGILATIVMMYGGVLWIIAGGNQERVTNARGYIVAALSGLVLTLASYTILNFINPELINLKPITPIKIGENSPLICCDQYKGQVSRIPIQDNQNNIINYICPPETGQCQKDQLCTKTGTLYYSCTIKPTDLQLGIKTCDEMDATKNLRLRQCIACDKSTICKTGGCNGTILFEIQGGGICCQCK
jgi:hypothetical protein